MKVLIIRLSALGDIVLTLDVVRSLLKENHEVHYFIKEKFQGVLEQEEFQSYLQNSQLHLHTLTTKASFRDLQAMVKKLKEIDFDIVLDLHRNLRSLWVTYQLKKKVYRIHKYRVKEFFLFIFKKKIFNALDLKPISRYQENLHILKKINPNQLPLQKEYKGNCDRFEHRGQKPIVIALAPDSAWPQKEWGLENFKAIGRHLKARDGISVVWIAQKTIAISSLEGHENYTGQWTLDKVGAYLKKIDLLICNDAGLLHLAEDQGVPVVAIYGPTSPELGFNPRLKESRVVEKKMWCRPCSKNGRSCIRPFHKQKCLKNIEVDEVMQEIGHFLSMREVDRVVS